MSNLVITDLAVAQELSAKALAEVAGGCVRRPRRRCFVFRGKKICIYLPPWFPRHLKLRKRS